MGWSYVAISMDDLMKLIKNFIDMLILATGYQSTGRLAQWDYSNIAKCCRWAIFIENGLAPLSCATLSGAKDLLLKHLIQALPLRESHLKAIMAASVEMDLSNLMEKDKDCLNVYLEKLLRVPSDGIQTGKNDNLVYGDFSVSVVQELGRRIMAASSLSTAEAGLDCLWRAIEKHTHDVLGNTSNSKPASQSASLIAGEMEMVIESIIWNRWRSRSLSYMLHKRTIRLISGANLIISAPVAQWTGMFERLNITHEADALSETIELLLLGCAADRWSGAIQCLLSISYESLTISKICQEVFSSPAGSSANIFLKENLTKPKEKDVLDYLEVLLSNQLSQLWKLPPVLAAVAIPSWSRLFRSYLGVLENRFRGNSSAVRGCSCKADDLEHKECEVAERIWCLYIFHAVAGRAAVA